MSNHSLISALNSVPFTSSILRQILISVHFEQDCLRLGIDACWVKRMMNCKMRFECHLLDVGAIMKEGSRGKSVAMTLYSLEQRGRIETMLTCLLEAYRAV